MKIPKEIYGQRKIRDFNICKMYIDGMTVDEIAEKGIIKESRVYQILRKNGAFIERNVGWSKSKRLHVLGQIAKNAGLQITRKKDILNVLDQMRKEIEGDKPNVLIDNSKHIFQDIKIENREPNELLKDINTRLRMRAK